MASWRDEAHVQRPGQQFCTYSYLANATSVATIYRHIGLPNPESRCPLQGSEGGIGSLQGCELLALLMLRQVAGCGLGAWYKNKKAKLTC